MKRNIFIFTVCAILLGIGLTPTNTCETILTEKNLQPSDRNLQMATYNLYYDVNVLMVSKLYESVEIEGDHSSESGLGFDQKITMEEANKLFTIGIAIIWDTSDIHKWGLNGGWIHTKVEIYNYTGWISGHLQTSRVKLIGHCEMINITIYR